MITHGGGADANRCGHAPAKGPEGADRSRIVDAPHLCPFLLVLFTGRIHAVYSVERYVIQCRRGCTSDEGGGGGRAGRVVCL
jgi:hypothetical protein